MTHHGQDDGGYGEVLSSAARWGSYLLGPIAVLLFDGLCSLSLVALASEGVPA